MRARHSRRQQQGHANYKADSGAVVVMDVKTGRVVAMASYPTYDPNVWVGGITHQGLQAAHRQEGQLPATSPRAIQGQFAPGSTFKVVSTPAAVQAGYSLNGTYPCPSAYSIGGSASRQLRGRGVRRRSRSRRALEVSCDTIFYKFAYETWLRDGGLHPKKGAKDPFAQMAKAFGLGKPTGIDLPSEARGRIADRAWKKAYWKATKDFYCARPRPATPRSRAPTRPRAAYLQAAGEGELRRRLRLPRR